MALGSTIVLLMLVGFLPRSFFETFISPLKPHPDATLDAGHWMILVPPPVLEQVRDEDYEPEADSEEPEPDPVEPLWWTEGWRVMAEAHLTAPAVPTVQDSIRYLIDELGLGQELAMMARPDSIVAARLLIMQREDGFRFEELKPYFKAMTDARAYADIQSRKADMYDDHLGSSIMVPD